LENNGHNCKNYNDIDNFIYVGIYGLSDINFSQWNISRSMAMVFLDSQQFTLNLTCHFFFTRLYQEEYYLNKKKEKIKYYA
jgi:hypothetical protein